MSYEKVAGKTVGPRLREILVPRGSYPATSPTLALSANRAGRRLLASRRPSADCFILYRICRKTICSTGVCFARLVGIFLFTVVCLACVVPRVRLTREVASPVVGIPVRGPHKGRADMRTSVLQVCKLSSCVMPAC